MLEPELEECLVAYLRKASDETDSLSALERWKEGLVYN